jgi:hypothetical protein
MKPSEVRDLVSREHVQIRILATEVDADCRRALDGDSVDLKPRVVTLARLLWNHLALEDRLLVPLLQKLDAWGPVRVKEILSEHARQREELTVLTHRSRAGSAHALAAATRRLIADLRTDMDAEERDLLHPDLLRDDPVVVHQVTD